MASDRVRGALCGLGSAALFGLSTPAAKALVPAASPLALASLLYLGAAGALWTIRLLAPRRLSEAPLRSSDLPMLACIAVVGGMLGPILLLIGLAQVSAVTASLLLNLEAPLTLLLAVVVFGEHLSKGAALAAALMLSGAVLLGSGFADEHPSIVGVLCISAACLCWAIDNNLTQRLSLRDPLAIVCWKASAAGVGNLLLAYAVGARFPSPTLASAALLLGAASYGLSIVLDAYALRFVGAAREAAYFATAPFFGAAVGAMAFGERLTPMQIGAAVLMVAGTVALLSERHQHSHDHDALVHEHAHSHDEHHRHDHDTARPHSHVHEHLPLRHAHPHVSDAHHRHTH